MSRRAGIRKQRHCCALPNGETRGSGRKSSLKPMSEGIRSF